MCFQAETFGLMTGTPISPDVPKPVVPLGSAARRSIRTRRRQPSPADVAAFMKANGIDYIYVDALHPNTLVPDAIPIATSGDTRLLRCADDRRHAYGGRPLGWLQALVAELAITLADGSVWVSIGQGLLFGAVCLLFGIWVARFVGLLEADAPAGETLGVGLASGLLVLAAWWAAIASGGRSSFTPVAVGFAIAIGLAVVRRWRRAGVAERRR